MYSDLPIREKMESTTSYFSDEDKAVREFAYGKYEDMGRDMAFNFKDDINLNFI